MKRFACAFVLLLVACGSGSEAEKATPASPAAPPAASQVEAFKSGFTWAGSGPSRDLDADHEACLQEVGTAGGAAPLTRVAKVIHCMQTKGWAYKPKS